MDDHIILMLADDIACNSRNPHAPHVYYSVDHKCNLYGDEIQVSEIYTHMICETNRLNS